MIFYIIDFISGKINNIKKNHKKNPKKLKIFFIWITLIILATVIFYLLGAFESEDVPLKLNNNFNSFNKLDNYEISENELYNPLIPKKLNKIVDNIDSNPTNNISNYQKILSYNNSNITKSVPRQSKSIKKSLSNIRKLSKNNSFRNTSNNNKLYDVVSKNEVNIIDEVLSKMRNVSSPHMYQINDYNFE